jgi:hypothetical protein
MYLEQKGAIARKNQGSFALLGWTLFRVLAK